MLRKKVCGEYFCHSDKRESGGSFIYDDGGNTEREYCQLLFANIVGIFLMKQHSKTKKSERNKNKKTSSAAITLSRKIY